MTIDEITAGRVPERMRVSVAAQRGIYPQLRQAEDYEDTWIGPSIACPNGGLGFYFRVQAGMKLPAGTLLGTYFGENTDPPSTLTVKEAMAAWADNDYVLGGKDTGFVVKGHEECGPARANDGFERVNSHLIFNPTVRRMELQTQGPITAPHDHPVVFEVLVNYDTPYSRPSYWDARRRQNLPTAARQACQDYYSTGNKRDRSKYLKEMDSMPVVKREQGKTIRDFFSQEGVKMVEVGEEAQRASQVQTSSRTELPVEGQPGGANGGPAAWEEENSEGAPHNGKSATGSERGEHHENEKETRQ
jgi:hypothetical protein